MRTTIDRAGRLVIPKAIRERVGILSEGEVEITEDDGAIRIAPSAMSARIVDTDHGAVVRADEDVPKLTGDAVRQVTDSLRR